MEHNGGFYAAFQRVFEHKRKHEKEEYNYLGIVSKVDDKFIYLHCIICTSNCRDIWEYSYKIEFNVKLHVTDKSFRNFRLCNGDEIRVLDHAIAKNYGYYDIDKNEIIKYDPVSVLKTLILDNAINKDNISITNKTITICLVPNFIYYVFAIRNVDPDDLTRDLCEHGYIFHKGYLGYVLVNLSLYTKEDVASLITNGSTSEKENVIDVLDKGELSLLYTAERIGGKELEKFNID